MNIPGEKLIAYAEDFSSPEHEVLQQLSRDTQANVLMPQMLSGHLQGAFLHMLTSVYGARRILEIGTYTGYSAIAMALALPAGARLDTIDINDELETMVHKYIQQAGLQEVIHTHWGDALQILPQIEGPVDIVFIDADKTNYCRYYDLVFDKVAKGGLIVADNVLWSGKVLNEHDADEDTMSLREFNAMVRNDDRVENLLLPIRDGLMVARKV